MHLRHSNDGPRPATGRALAGSPVAVARDGLRAVLSLHRTRVAGLLALLAVAAVLATGAAQAPDVTVTINGAAVALDGVTIQNDVVVGPAKDFLERLGAEVDATPNGRALRAFAHDKVLTLMAGQPYLFTPDTVDLATAPTVDAQNRLIAPLAPLAEQLGLKVAWDGDSRTLAVGDADASEAPPAPKPRIPFTDEDLDLIARVIYSEAPEEPFEGQVAVGAVIINRVLSPHFPDNVHDVVFAPGQFQGTKSALFKKDPSDSAVRAAKAALYGEDPSHGAYYFYDPRTVTSKWIFTLKVLATIGHHRFATNPAWAPAASQ